MPEVVVFPDAELMLVRHLADVLGTGVYVCTAVPPDDEIRAYLPVVRVLRVGGGWTIRKQLDQALVDIDVWHTQLKPLNDLVAQVRAEVEAMQGLVDPAVGGVVTQTTEVVGPRRLPEEDPQLIRAGFTVGLLLRRV